MIIKVLGTGCKKCNLLEREVNLAVEELCIECEVKHITDINEIMSYSVMSTPALVINEKLVSSGRVLKKKKVIELIRNAWYIL